MKTEDFKSKLTAVSDSFFSFWEEGRKLYPSQFPDDMHLNDWLEHFVMYAEDKLGE